MLYTRRVHEEILEKKDKHLMLEILLNFLAEENSEGYILKIGQRINSLVRPPIVNIDQAVVIMSVKEPDFNCNLLDRFLVLLEHKNIKPVIYISKMDLVEDDSEMKAIQKQYQRSLVLILSSVWKNYCRS